MLIAKNFTSTGTGEAFTSSGPETTWTHSAVVTGTGAVSATVVIEASNDPAGAAESWFTLGTITLSGTTSAVDALSGVCASPLIRHRCAAISGTGAAVRSISAGK